MRYLLAFFLFFQSFLNGVSTNNLEEILISASRQNPFNFDLGIYVLPGPLEDAPVMLCFHGYGSNSRFIDIVRQNPEINDHLVAFNFPDYDLLKVSKDPQNTTFGTINELLPALYLLKKLVVDGYINRIDLYGFSAGGGAIVNVIAILNSRRYDKELKWLGISLAERSMILNAIQKGKVILDCPLKSMEEIIAFRGRSREFDILEQRYRQNCLVPIESLEALNDLSLNILVHFQQGDEALSNRDDVIYINRLRRVNCKGNTCAVIGYDGGHKEYHKALWKTYPDFVAEKCSNACVEYSH